MKINLLSTLLATVLFVGTACAQKKSPAAKVEQKVGETMVTIDYHQPSMKGRAIFGGLVPYGKVWRTGANNATTIEFSKDVTINGKAVKAGKYALFTIPNENEWTIIINSEHDQWGAYKYNEKKDVTRFSAKPAEHNSTEKMTFSIDENGTVNLDWASTRVSFNIKG